MKNFWLDLSGMSVECGMSRSALSDRMSEESCSGALSTFTECSASRCEVKSKEPAKAGLAMSSGDVSPRPPCDSGSVACSHAGSESEEPRIWSTEARMSLM